MLHYPCHVGLWGIGYNRRVDKIEDHNMLLPGSLAKPCTAEQQMKSYQQADIAGDRYLNQSIDLSFQPFGALDLFLHHCNIAFEALLLGVLVALLDVLFKRLFLGL